MKKRFAPLILLLIFSFSIILAENQETKSLISSNTPSLSISNQPSLDPWNETIIISPVWQTLIGTFFGLNLKKVSTQISVRETLTLLAIFVMFLVLFYDIIKLTPFFKSQNYPTEFIASLSITTIVSISGSLINLKDIFLQAVYYTITKLNLNIFASTSILTGILIIIFFVFIVLFFNMINPIIKRYSQISRAKAKGRRLNSVLENQEAI